MTCLKSRRGSHLLMLMGLLWMAACAVPDYRMGDPNLGGYSEKELSPDLWSVTYRANDAATTETLTTYWLYRAASLALETGHDGFRVVGGFPPLISTVGMPDRWLVAAAAPMLLYAPNYEPKPFRRAYSTIRLLHAPLPRDPYRVFDAARVKAILQPVVFGRKCDRNNVCPYEVRDLVPDP